MIYVRLMADYCSSGLWDESGMMIDDDTLPLSAALKARINSWVRWYDATARPEEILNPSFDLTQFVPAGLKIAKAIKKELPIGSTVMYFNEATLRTDEIR